MVEASSGCRHPNLVQPTDNKYIDLGQIDDVPPFDDKSDLTPLEAYESKLRPQPRRSLASFASCLSTHCWTAPPSSRPEAFDWSNLSSLNDRDNVYNPDTEFMCTTITKQVLANPSTDLPAQYNTFLLHLIDAYHQLKADVQELRSELIEETECKQATVDDLDAARALDKAFMLQSPGQADLNTLRSSEPSKEAIDAGLRKNSPSIQTPESVIDYENNSQRQEYADQVRTSERLQLTSCSWRYRELNKADLNFESSHDHWPLPPHQHDRELFNCEASSVESDDEVRRVLVSTSDAFSGLGDDIASRLVWFTFRLSCQPGDVISELSKLLRSTQNVLGQGPVPSSISTFRQNMPTASEEVNSSQKDQMLPRRPNKLKGTTGSHSIRPLGHRRGFSFLPGDDTANPISCKISGCQDMDFETNSFHTLASPGEKQSENSGSGGAAKEELGARMAVISKSKQLLSKSVMSPTVRPRALKNPQLDGLGRSILNAIVSSSSRSSSVSHKGPLNSTVDSQSLREDSIRRGNGRLAVAAARAAKPGAVNFRDNCFSS